MNDNEFFELERNNAKIYDFEDNDKSQVGDETMNGLKIDSSFDRQGHKKLSITPLNIDPQSLQKENDPSDGTQN